MSPDSKESFKVLAIGDIFAESGIDFCKNILPELIEQEKIDFVVANGENAAKDGRGLLEKTCQSLFSSGVDFITTGNHIWRYDQFFAYLDSNSDKVIRPINFPATNPGKGYSIVEKNGFKVGIINVMGRVFFRETLDCPLKTASSAVDFLKDKTDIILVDFHAEATSEKLALAFYLDGKVDAVWGTHTHVQTADERILPKGTAYITDLGFCGALNSCIGVNKETVINQYLSQMPARFRPETEGEFVFSSVIFEFCRETKKAISVKRKMIKR